MSKPIGGNEWHANFSTEQLKKEIRWVEHRILVDGKTEEQSMLDAMCGELGTREEC